MQSRFQSTTIRCYSSPVSYQTNSFRMPARESALRKGDGFESKGMVLLVICGLYAVFLFVLARLCSCIVSSFMSSVKTVFVKREVTEVAKVTKVSKTQVSLVETSQKKDAREPVRTVCHG